MRKKSDKERMIVMSLCIPPDEKAALNKQAQLLGKSSSEFIRDLFRLYQSGTITISDAR